MKEVKFILQSKGGVGKSTLTALLVYKILANAGVKLTNSGYDSSMFPPSVRLLDIDASTSTTANRFPELAGKTNIQSGKDRMPERGKFLEMLEGFAAGKADQIYCDFGASESAEILHLFQIGGNEFSEELKMNLEDLGIRLSFWVVVAGGTAYEACWSYVESLNDAVAKQHPVVVFASSGLFTEEDDATLNRLKVVCAAENIPVREFGQFDNSQGGSKAIFELMRGNTESELLLGGRMKMGSLVRTLDIS